MQQSQLVILLQTMNKVELSQLMKFVNSPFHNSHEKVKELCHYLIGLYPRWHSPKLDRQYIFKVLFPNSGYKDIALRRIQSKLLKLAEAFISYQEFTRADHIPDLYLLRAYQHRQLPKHYQKAAQSTQKVMLAQTQKGQAFYFQNYLFQEAQNRYLEGLHQRNIEPNLQALSDSLDHLYLVNKLKCCCAMMSYQNLVNIEYNLPLLDPIFDHLNIHWRQYPFAIAIYYFALLTLVEPAEASHFQQLKELLQKEEGQLPLSELQDIYVLARNYCIKQLNQGEEAYLQELFNIYQSELNNGTLLTEGFISPLDYKNIVSVALRLTAFDWVAQFIEDYKTLLPLDFRENSYRYNLAQLHFARKDYDQVVLLLHQLEHDELFLGLDSRRLLLKTYYELEEWETLEALLGSFSAYVRRHPTVGYHRTNYLHLIKFCRRLTTIAPYETDKRVKLREAIIIEGKVVDKAWLLEKIEANK